jgi:outer membrane lipoprotein SlyB
MALRIRMLKHIAPLAAALALAGCKTEFSPNTYNAEAVQQANKVDQGVVVGVRAVDVKVAGTTGAVAGAAAGGIAGSQLGGSSATQALGAVGGGLIGSLIGSASEQAMDNTKAYEYIVRMPKGDLVSVTQTDTTPLALGQHVLVIAGKQARIVPDYTSPVAEPPKEDKDKDTATKSAPAKDAATKDAPAKDATPPETPAKTDAAPSDSDKRTAPIEATPLPDATPKAPTPLSPPSSPTPTPTLPPETPPAPNSTAPIQL